MGNEKIVTVNYQSDDDAAAMAAKINSADRHGDVRVVSNGRTLEISTANPLASELVVLFRWASRKVATLFSSEDKSSKGAVSA